MAGDCFSNLTTFYPKLSFARRTISQLKEDPRLVHDKNVVSKDSIDRVHLWNFIPEVPFRTEDGRPGSFCSHIVFSELEDTEKGYNHYLDNSIWKFLKERFNKTSKGRSSLLSSCESETHGFNLIQLYKRKGESIEPCTFVERHELNDEKDLDFHFVLSIYLQKLPPESLLPSPRSVEFCKRTALLARELIGGYRRLVSLILYYSGYIDECPNMVNGHYSESDYHATKEDANRLIAHFKFLSTEMRALGIEPDKLGLWELNRLDTHPKEDELSLTQIRKRLSDTLVVSEATIARKLFEYAMYIDLKQ